MEQDEIISYKDILTPFPEMNPEEREELEKKLKEESDKLTDWPKL